MPRPLRIEYADAYYPVSPPKPLDYYSRKYTHRNKAMAEAYRSGHYTLSQVGNHFGVSYGTVSRAVKKYNV